MNASPAVIEFPVGAEDGPTDLELVDSGLESSPCPQFAGAEGRAFRIDVGSLEIEVEDG